MRTRALARAATVVAASTAAIALTMPSTVALVPDPDAPVTAPDAVAVYPYGVAVVDVLANDVDPDDRDGSQLAICRLPDPDGDLSVADGAGLFGEPGTLAVELGRARLAEPVVVEYHVCDHSRLTPSTLTVTMREVEPVTVRTVPGRPGRLKVVNANDSRIVFMSMAKRDFRMVRVPARSSRVLRVHSHVVRWQAVIGSVHNSGIAGRGVVRDIELPENEPERPRRDGGVGITTTQVISPLSMARLLATEASVVSQPGGPPGIGASGS